MMTLLHIKDTRGLLFQWLTCLDRAMLLLALFTFEDHGTLGSWWLHNIWEYLNTRIIYENLTVDITRLGYAKIFRMFNERGLIRKTRSMNIGTYFNVANYANEMWHLRDPVRDEIMTAAVISGSVDMIREVWSVGIYCNHVNDYLKKCCVDVAVECGHFELAERLAWGSITGISIADIISGDMSVSNTSKTRARDDDFDLVNDTDRTIYDRCRTHGYVVISHKIPTISAVSIINRLAIVGDLDSIVRLQSHDDKYKTDTEWILLAYSNGHINIIINAHSLGCIADPLSLIHYAIKGSHLGIIDQLFELCGLSKNETRIWPMLSAAALVGYNAYIKINDIRKRHGIKPEYVYMMNVMKNAMVTGDTRTLNHLHAELLKIPQYVNLITRPCDRIYYGDTNGNINSIQWLHDNWYPAKSLTVVGDFMSPMQIPTAKKLLSLGCVLDHMSIVIFIRGERSRLISWLYLGGHITPQLIEDVEKYMSVGEKIHLEWFRNVLASCKCSCAV